MIRKDNNEILKTIEKDISLEDKKKNGYVNELKKKKKKGLNISLPYLSMGMSDDYKVAICEGATHVRLGRVLFSR